MRKQYQWIIEEELQSLENKKKVRIQIHKDTAPPTCKPEWPICLDSCEKAKQKKRNSSSFGFRVQNISSSKANYLTVEYKAAHPNKNPLLKKRLETRARGRDRITKYEDGRGRVKLIEAEKAKKHQGVTFSKDELSPPGSGRESNHELSPCDSREMNTSVEAKKSSESILTIQNYMVIGRMEHSCKEGLAAVAKTTKIEDVRKDSGEIRETEPVVQKKPITRPSARTEIKRPQFLKQQPSTTHAESSPENSETSTPSTLKGLFGTDNIKRMPTSPVESREDPKYFHDKETLSLPPTNISYSTEDSPQYPTTEEQDPLEFEEEEIVRKKPRKTIYNILLETNFEDEDEPNPMMNIDNGRKSIMFMKHFFKDDR